MGGRKTPLDELLKKAFIAFNSMSPWEQLKHREEQRVSFVYGNLSASTHHRVPLKTIRRMAMEMWLDDMCASGDPWVKAIRKLDWRLWVMGITNYYAGPEGG